MGNFSEALSELERLRAQEVEAIRLRRVLEKIRDVQGNDVERLKRIAREGLEGN